MNRRIFEALAAGSFLLTDCCNELDELYTAGKELETFRRAFREFIDKIDYYLCHDDEKEAIARNGCDLFNDKFTWKRRVQKLAALMLQDVGHGYS